MQPTTCTAHTCACIYIYTHIHKHTRWCPKACKLFRIFYIPAYILPKTSSDLHTSPKSRQKELKQIRKSLYLAVYSLRKTIPYYTSVSGKSM